MGKFCTNCGKEIKDDQDICLGCGRIIKKEQKLPPKDHKTYIIATGIIMIIISASLLISGLSESTLEYGNRILMFTIPGVLGIIGGTLGLLGNKDKKLLLISGLVYFSGALINFVAIIDISIFAILAIVFGIFNIIYSKEKQK